MHFTGCIASCIVSSAWICTNSSLKIRHCLWHFKTTSVMLCCQGLCPEKNGFQQHQKIFFLGLRFCIFKLMIRMSKGAYKKFTGHAQMAWLSLSPDASASVKTGHLGQSWVREAFSTDRQICQSNEVVNLCCSCLFISLCTLHYINRLGLNVMITFIHCLFHY